MEGESPAPLSAGKSGRIITISIQRALAIQSDRKKSPDDWAEYFRKIPTDNVIQPLSGFYAEC